MLSLLHPLLQVRLLALQHAPDTGEVHSQLLQRSGKAVATVEMGSRASSQLLVPSPPTLAQLLLPLQ